MALFFSGVASFAKLRVIEIITWDSFLSSMDVQLCLFLGNSECIAGVGMKRYKNSWFLEERTLLSRRFNLS
jgi:hypothetical protein